MARSKKPKPGSRMEALAEALNALNPHPLEVALTHPGPLPEGARLERRLINTVPATDRTTTVSKVYREETVPDDDVPPLSARRTPEYPDSD